jgi:hypothetical protein
MVASTMAMRWRREPDPNLRRFERNNVIACAAMAVVASLVGRLDVAFGIVGGGVLTAVGYAGIKSAVNLLLPAADAEGTTGPRGIRRRRPWAAVLKFVSRYALLALAAYVMLMRLHMHPVGLLLGASAPALSAAAELVAIGRSPRAGQSR